MARILDAPGQPLSRLAWSTLMGGNGWDSGRGIALLTPDSAPTPVIFGATDSNDGFWGSFANNPIQTALSGTTDACVGVVAQDGSSFLRGTYFGGSHTDIYDPEAAWAGAVDSEGNIYLVGETRSSEAEGFPLVNSLQETHGNPQDPELPDAFVAKLSSDLSTIRYSTYLGGGSIDRGMAVAVHGAGDAYVVGSTARVTDPFLPFPIVNPLPDLGTLPGAEAAFVSKISDGSGVRPSIQFVQAIYEAPDEGRDPPFGSRAVITVGRSGDLTSSTSVDYVTADGTATQPADYGATSGTLTFGPGEQAQAFVVPIVDDNLAEGTETIGLSLSNPTGGAILGALTNALIAILDNDGLVREVQIRDRVGGAVNWQIVPGYPTWLTFSRTSGTGPSTITATADVTDLSVGTYEASVIVTGDTGDSPQFVRVILLVQ